MQEENKDMVDIDTSGPEVSMSIVLFSSVSGIVSPYLC